MGKRKTAHKSGLTLTNPASRFFKPATSSKCGKLLRNTNYQSVTTFVFWTIRSQALLLKGRSREQKEMGTFKSLRYVPPEIIIFGSGVFQLERCSGCCVIFIQRCLLAVNSFVELTSKKCKIKMKALKAILFYISNGFVLHCRFLRRRWHRDSN